MISLYDDVVKKRWWTSADVAVYLGMKGDRKGANAARMWMVRKGVRKCENDRRFTCQAWVDAVLKK